MNLVKAILKLLVTQGRQEVQDFCGTEFADTGVLTGWNLQDTPYGCNGDIVPHGNEVLVVSHTNPEITAKTNWKHNRVEWAREIKKVEQRWKFKVKFHKLCGTSDWVILSQFWNRKHNNVLSLVVQQSTKYPGQVKLRLDKKVGTKPTTLWSGYFDMWQEHSFDLTVKADGVTGSINGQYVGDHEVEVYADGYHQEIKFGLYWAGAIPFEQKNHMALTYKV